MKAPKNFMKFPYNLLKKATITDCIYNKGEFTVDITIKDTWLMKLLKKILKYEESEDDEEVSKVIDDYIDDYYKMWSESAKFYKVKDLVDEQFYEISED